MKPCLSVHHLLRLGLWEARAKSLVARALRWRGESKYIARCYLQDARIFGLFLRNSTSVYVEQNPLTCAWLTKRNQSALEVML